MTDENDTHQPHCDPDHRAAEGIERALTARGDALNTEERAWREVWGSLPETLDPVAPGPQTWSRIRARLHDDEVARDSLTPSPTRPVRNPANDHGWSTAANRWAAALIVALLGTAMWLGHQVRVKDAEIADLQREVTISTAGFSVPGAVPAASAANFGFVAADSVESCSLEAQGELEGARGWLYMGGEQPSCFLAVEGLQPLAEGQIYKAWFRSQGRAVPVGVLTLDGGRGEMFSAEVPAHVDAVFVTVEPASESATAPQGPMVLYGDSVIASL